MKSNNKDFQKDLAALRQKYPMCYVEAWTPEDFCSEAVTGKECLVFDWYDPAHELTAEILYESFDANLGTCWASVEDALSDPSLNE